MLTFAEVCSRSEYSPAISSVQFTKLDSHSGGLPALNLRRGCWSETLKSTVVNAVFAGERWFHGWFHWWLHLATSLLCTLSLSACTTTGLVISAAGLATDTSITWAIAKHVHQKITEGDPVPCIQLNSVQRALAERCGSFVPGSNKAAVVEFVGFGVCPLSIAARDPQFWPVMTELLQKGARLQNCQQSPLVDLAQTHACPDFQNATQASVRSLSSLAQVDGRAVHHDVLRMLSCPNSRSVGLDRLIDRWMAQDQLPLSGLGFSPLSALHPDHLNSTLAMALQAQGHTVQAALAAQDGKLPSGFEAALRASHWQALDWWLARRPDLAKSVPPAKSTQLPWLPLARVLVPQFLDHPDTQADMLSFLIARGASPLQVLPADNGKTVLSYAAQLKSPMVTLLTAASAARPSLPPKDAAEAAVFAKQGTPSARQLP